jgi:D-3-phosphoglycerate dehydrogenase / 2-oxoglutarate reductase
MPPLVALTDQVFPNLDVERSILSGIGAELELLPDPSPDTIRTQAAGAEALLTTYAPIDRETIGALERCRVISRYGIGVDNIDLEAARERGITVTNVPDYCVDEVADHVLALLLAAARKIVLANSVVRAGGWGIGELVPVRRLRGRKLGLVGFGHIGAEVARRAASLGLEVSAYDPYVPAERLSQAGVSAAGSLEELLEGSDFVSVQVPLVESTRGLIDEAAVARMKPDAVLINTARGPIVSTEAVVAALREGRLGAACLDVFEAEPPDASVFADLPNLIATPHSAFYSEESIQESQTRAAQAIVDVLGGREPRNRVV